MNRGFPRRVEYPIRLPCGGNEDTFRPGWEIRPEDPDHLAHFGPWYYLDEPWYRGASPSGASNDQVIMVDGREFLFFHLEIDLYAKEVLWAQGVFNRHPNTPTVLTTDRYLYDLRAFGGRFNRLISERVGGDGWLRAMVFDPSANQVLGFTYSPWLEKLRDRETGFMESMDGAVTYADRAGRELDFSPEEVEALREFLESPLAAAGIYLLGYAAGTRDPFFVLPVDFDAYRADAPRAPPSTPAPSR